MKTSLVHGGKEGTLVSEYAMEFFGVPCGRQRRLEANETRPWTVVWETWHAQLLTSGRVQSADFRKFYGKIKRAYVHHVFAPLF